MLSTHIRREIKQTTSALLKLLNKHVLFLKKLYSVKKEMAEETVHTPSGPYKNSVHIVW